MNNTEQLKQRYKELKSELTIVERYLSNPFVGKELSPEKRKVMYEKALLKKKLLLDEMSNTIKEIKQIESAIEAARLQAEKELSKRKRR